MMFPRIPRRFRPAPGFELPNSRAHGPSPKNSLASSESDYELDAAGVLAGSDKTCVRAENYCAWDYSRHYEEFFREWRHENINLIEIGVASGASLDMWLRYFDRARVVGIDIDPNCAVHARGRAEVRLGSQDDEVVLHGVAREFPPTIIIDDGSHEAAHIMKSFEILFPHLLPGGVYVIEDLALHFDNDGLKYWPKQNPPSVSGPSLYEFLSSLVTAKLAYANVTAPFSEIDEVRIIGGAILVRKTKPRDEVQMKLALERELERLAVGGGRKYSYACFRMSEYFMTYHNAADAALQYLDKGLLYWPDNPYALQLRRKALLALGRHSEAREIGERLQQLGARPDLMPIVKRPYMAYPHR